MGGIFMNGNPHPTFCEVSFLSFANTFTCDSNSLCFISSLARASECAPFIYIFFFFRAYESYAGAIMVVEESKLLAPALCVAAAF